MDNKDFYICKYINKPISKVGLPYDEAAIIVFLFLLFALMGDFLTAVIAAFIGFLLIKKLKKGQGSAYLLCLLYWFTPLMRLKFAKTQDVYFLKKVPAAEKRHWI